MSPVSSSSSFDRQHLPQPSHSDSHSAGLISSSVLVFQNGSYIPRMWPSGGARSSYRSAMKHDVMATTRFGLQMVAQPPRPGNTARKTGTNRVPAGLRNDGTQKEKS